MKNKITVGIIIVAIILLGASLSGVFSNKVDTTEPVKIGLSLPLTGGAAFLGESAKQAAELALKDAGVTKYKYDLLIEDDAFTPAKTATVASKFVNVDKIFAMITFGSGTSNAAAPITENAKIVRFGLASDPTSAVGEYNFIHWTPAFKEGELITKELSNRGYKNIAIVDANHPGPMAVTSAIKKSL
ncbi:MAG: ABC transporter substrate-binding protein, partial [bacterium]